MPTLYVIEPGAHLELHYAQLQVRLNDKRLQAVPLHLVHDVVLVGSVGITQPAMHALLQQGSTLSLIQPNGKLLGRLINPDQHNLPLRHQQYACATQPDFVLNISKQCVLSKLKNSAVLLRRWLTSAKKQPNARLLPAQAFSVHQQLRILRQKAGTVQTLSELRGVEGYAAKLYFGALKHCLRQNWNFPRRSRRPPRDELNALLSFCYSLLTQTVLTACTVAGLDAYDGFFHADKYGRPALALDLMETFRAPIADSVVMTLVNQKH
jgi:CRISPR-associated protein Cas1